MKGGAVSTSKLISIVEEMWISRLREKTKEGDDKGKSNLWMEAFYERESKSQFVKACKLLAARNQPLTIDDLRVHAQAGEDEGKTLLWLLLNAATYDNTEPFYYAWEVCQDSISIKDLRKQAQRGYCQGQTVLWLAATAAAFSCPDPFIFIWKKLSDKIEFSDMLICSQVGADKKRNLWWFLADATKYGITEPFLLAWEKFSACKSEKDLLAALLIKDNDCQTALSLLGQAAAYGIHEPLQRVWEKCHGSISLRNLLETNKEGVSFLTWLSAAAAEGWEDPFLEVWARFADHLPADIVRTPIQQGAYKGCTILSNVAAGVASGWTKSFQTVWSRKRETLVCQDWRTEDHHGSTGLWSLAAGLSQEVFAPFTQVWYAFKSDWQLTDFLHCPRDGKYKDLSVLFLLAEASNKFPDLFLEIWHAFKDEITVKDLLFSPQEGLHQNRSVLGMLILAALDGVTKPLQEVWQQVHEHFTFHDLLRSMPSAVFPNLSLLGLLICLVSNHFVQGVEMFGSTYNLNYLLTKRSEQSENDQFFLQILTDIVNMVKALPNEQLAACLVELDKYQFFDMAALGEDQQQPRLEFYGANFPLCGKVLQKMLDGCIKQMATQGLLSVAVKKNKIYISFENGAEVTGYNIIKKFLGQYAWLEKITLYSSNIEIQVAEESGPILLGEFYAAINALMQELVILKQNSPIVLVHPPAPAPSIAARTQNPVVEIKQVGYFPSGGEYVKADKKLKDQTSRTVGTSFSSRSPNVKQRKGGQKITPKRHSTVPAMGSVQKHEEKFPSRAMSAPELPAPTPYYLVKPTKDIDYVSQEERREEKEQLQQASQQVAVDTQSLRKVDLARKEKVADLRKLLAIDEYYAYLIFDLALFDILSKINRDLSYLNAIYKTDCALIHGTHKNLQLANFDANLEHSNLSLYIQQCFLHDGFQELNALVVKKQGFYKESLKALEQDATIETLLYRFKTIKSLLYMLLLLQGLLNEEEFDQNITKHALSSVFLILGEQYKELKKQNVDEDLFGNEDIGKCFKKYKRYRNLRHGPELRKTTAGDFHDDKEWEDVFPSLLKELEHDVITLHQPIFHDLLHNNISKLEKHIESSEVERKDEVREDNPDEVVSANKFFLY